MTSKTFPAAGALVLALAAGVPSLGAQADRDVRHITLALGAGTLSELRAADAEVERQRRDGGLALQRATTDLQLPAREHERYAQLHGGVPIVGAGVVRQVAGGQTESLFGRVYEGVALDTRPTLSSDAAREVVAKLAGRAPGRRHAPELTILPHDGDQFSLAWRVKAFGPGGLMLYYIDAHTGALVHQHSALHTQASVARAQGVLGDPKKISVESRSGRFGASDRLRPGGIITYDLRGNRNRLIDILNGDIDPDDTDLAVDADNKWTDGATVDAHVYAGWTYDYLFKRFNRRGLDDANIPMRSVVHPVRREDVLTAPEEDLLFYLNAAYIGDGIVFYGVGLPDNVRAGGLLWNHFSGALDIVAHELAHGVTDYSSQLIYENESGALNEAFSDIIGTAVEFMFQPAGTGLRRADYLIAEDIATPGGFRSMADPGRFGDPDHYSRRYRGPEDNGGVHINSGIVNHMFYLAVEGGTNRTSGLRVEGIGGANREQAEKVIYRAFTLLLPSGADFALARRATQQAARDLYGSGSAVERAFEQAWTAVGVQ